MAVELFNHRQWILGSGGCKLMSGILLLNLYGSVYFLSTISVGESEITWAISGVTEFGLKVNGNGTVHFGPIFVQSASTLKNQSLKGPALWFDSLRFIQMTVQFCSRSSIFEDHPLWRTVQFRGSSTSEDRRLWRIVHFG